MLFNSFIFLIFFLVVYCLYHSLPFKFRKGILFSSSVIFYGSWDILVLHSKIPVFLIHFLLVIFINYLFILGIKNAKSERKRKFQFLVILLLNLLNLGFFKYFYFITGLVGSLFGFSDLEMEVRKSFTIILPIAISFYTFQIIAFVVDVYRKTYTEKVSFLDFAIFILFFPQQIAGPILRASEFLPQLKLKTELSWNHVINGLSLVGFGLAKKVILADSIAIIINPIYSNPLEYSGFTVVVAFLGFTIQIWGDFSGYSDIARGCSKLLGIEIPENFKGPFLSASFAEVWNRWHITLSSFLRDYIFISLGGSRGANWKTYFNIILTFTLGGLWHGANLTFLIWGFLWGLLLALERAVLMQFKFWSETLTKKIFLLKVTFVFSIFVLLSGIFRASKISDYFLLLKKLNYETSGKVNYEEFSYLVFLFIILHSIEYKPELITARIKRPLIWVTLSAIILFFIITSISSRTVTFYYFQF